MLPSRIGDKVVDDGRWRHDVIWSEHADRNDIVRASDDCFGSHRDHWLKFRAVSA
jgi:hypothetical protein